MIEVVGLFLAGLIGGMVNAIAGGGSFITFPALMAAGVPPIAANATNTFASSAGYLSGAAGFRRELWAHRRQLPKIAVSALGGALLALSLLLVCTYGGFFNAGLGIILLGYFTLAGYQDIHLMNGLKLLVSGLVSILAIVVFGMGDLIAWGEGAIVLIGTLIGGYAAASAVSQRLVRRAIIVVAAGMTAYFFIAN